MSEGKGEEGREAGKEEGEGRGKGTRWGDRGGTVEDTSIPPWYLITALASFHTFPFSASF